MMLVWKCLNHAMGGLGSPHDFYIALCLKAGNIFRSLICGCTGFDIIPYILNASKVVRPFKTSNKINATKTSKIKSYFAKLSEQFATAGSQLELAAA